MSVSATIALYTSFADDLGPHTPAFAHGPTIGLPSVNGAAIGFGCSACGAIGSYEALFGGHGGYEWLSLPIGLSDLVLRTTRAARQALEMRLCRVG